jgi:5-methylcytosine-specific restriction protein A
MSRGNKILKAALLARTPVRHWTGPKGGPFTFDKWAMVTEVGRVREPDEDGVLASRFVWFLTPVGGPSAEEWPREFQREPDPTEVKLEEVLDDDLSSDPGANYALICESLGDPKASVEQVRGTAAKRFKRRKIVRDLVVARSGGVCENATCTGMPCDVGPENAPLLDVDHIVGLAEGGGDHPLNAVALCPNCHRAKTLGVNKVSLTRSLRRMVQKKHSEFSQRTPGVS